jgi:tight adherence protein B
VTAVGWLAAAAGLSLLAPAARPDARLIRLSGGGRLGGAAAGHRPGVRVRPGWLVVGAAVLVAGVTALAGPALGLALAGAAFAAWRMLRNAAALRADKRQRAELAAALAVVTAELEAGSRPPEALRAAAAVAPNFASALGRAAAEAAAGGSASSALAADATAQTLACAWELGERTGAALTGVLRRVAADLAAEAEHRRTVEIALAGPRASAVVLAGLPLVGLALGAAMGADPLHFLLRTPAGAVVAAVGVLLDVGGLLWIQAILRRAGTV